MANRVQPADGSAGLAGDKQGGGNESAAPAVGPTRPKVAIVGGGCAGLVTAYLLENDCDVVLFEAGARVGGHADTILAEKDGKVFASVDMGADFLPSEKYYQDFFRLLDILGVGLYEVPNTVTYYDPDKPHSRGMVVLPPPFVVNGRLFRSLEGLGKATSLFRTLLKGRKLAQAGDTSTTLQQMLDGMELSAERRELLVTLVNGMYPGPSKADCRLAVASDIFGYTSELLTRPLTSSSMHVQGGMQAYVQVLRGRLQAARVRVGAAVAGVEQVEGGKWRVMLEGVGEQDVFDHVVLASEAVKAQQILSGVPAAKAVYAAISGITGQWTKVAIHSDTSFLPPHPNDWSTLNICPDAGEVITSVYQHWERSSPETPVFKTWLTHASRQPASSQTYLVKEYWHPQHDRAYFEAQAQLAAVNGSGGLWLAGVYTNGISSHNSAVRSAMEVALALAPQAPRLLQLLERPKQLKRGQGCCA